MVGIYCITNKVNGKKYFGQSINIERRKRRYFNEGIFPNDHLKNAFNKYGKENFEFEIIKYCKEEYLDRFEKLYIRIYDTMDRKKGYNKDSGGNLNKYPSEETRKKMSETQKGKKRSLETRNKISDAMKGQQHFLGHKHTQETKNKMSESQSGENNHKWKNYARIVKHGKNRNGKQDYAIKYNGKVFFRSIYKERLFEKWYDKHPDIKLIDETK